MLKNSSTLTVSVSINLSVNLSLDSEIDPMETYFVDVLRTGKGMRKSLFSKCYIC